MRSSSHLSIRGKYCSCELSPSFASRNIPWNGRYLLLSDIYTTAVSVWSSVCFSGNVIYDVISLRPSQPRFSLSLILSYPGTTQETNILLHSAARRLSVISTFPVQSTRRSPKASTSGSPHLVRPIPNLAAWYFVLDTRHHEKYTCVQGGHVSKHWDKAFNLFGLGFEVLYPFLLWMLACYLYAGTQSQQA